MSSGFDNCQILQAYEDIGFKLDEKSKLIMANFLELFDSPESYEHRIEIGPNTKNSCVTHNLAKYILDGVISKVCPKNITQITFDSNTLMKFSIRFNHCDNKIKISTECDSFHFDRNIFYRIVLQIIDILERDKPEGNLKICYSACIVNDAREYAFTYLRNNEPIYIAPTKGSNVSELLEHIALKLKQREYPKPTLCVAECQKVLRAYQDLGFIFDTLGPYQKNISWHYKFCYFSDNIIIVKTFCAGSTPELWEHVMRCIQVITPQSIRAIIPYIVDEKITPIQAVTPKDSNREYTDEFQYSLSFYSCTDSTNSKTTIISSFVPNFQNIEMYYRTILEFIEFQETNLLDSLTEKLMIKFDRIGEKDGERFKLECYYGDHIFNFKSQTFIDGLTQLFDKICPLAPTPPPSDSFMFLLERTPPPQFFFRETSTNMVGLFQISNFDSSIMYGVKQEDGSVELRTHTKDVIVKMKSIHSFLVGTNDVDKWLMTLFSLGKNFNPEHKYIILVNNKEEYNNSLQQGFQIFLLLSRNI